MTLMIRLRLLTAFLSALILSGCIRHLGRPNAELRHRPAGRYTVHENVPYGRAGGEELLADLYVPEGPGPFPGVVVIHGGGWYKGHRGQMRFVCKRLARRGYAAVSISYRFAPAHRFPAQLHDCKKAVRWMRSEGARLYRVDPGRIGAFGYSAGAQLAALLGSAGPDLQLEGEESPVSSRVQAVAAGAGPLDLRLYPDSALILQFLGTDIRKNPKIFDQASPAAQVTKDDPPFFLYHGTWDRVVFPVHSLDMKTELDRAGIPAELYLVRGLGHVPLYLFNRSSIEAAIDFFDRRL